MVATGSTISANAIGPILLFMVTFIGNIIEKIFIPIVLLSTVLSIISQISDRVQISNLAKFLKSSVIWTLGISLTIFVGVLSLEGTLGSSVDGITAKTAKAVVSSSIPVVGKLLGETVDAVIRQWLNTKKCNQCFWSYCNNRNMYSSRALFVV